MQRMQMTAVAYLAVASARQVGGETEPNVERVIEAVQRASVAPSQRYDKSILWVDDRPTNNAYTQRAFESVGVLVSFALSTQEALVKLEKRLFDVIISDMGRKEGPREGYVLLDQLRSNGNKIPIFIHASSSSLEHKAETAQHGGQGCTNNPSELFRMVMDVLSD